MNVLRMMGVAVCLLVCACAYAQEAVNIDINKKFQQIKGWGTSLCWWAAEVGKWDDAQIDEIVDIAVSPDKLNMNLFRYNIGGGDDPSHIDGHMLKKHGGKGKHAEMEGFKDGPDAPYNWSRDAAQRKIMLKIKEKRPDAVFEAFSNSAPYWMTHSKCSGGNFDGNKDNLMPEYYEMFCDYLIDVCKHYKEVYGLEFATLEPFNESVSPNIWHYKGSQEGCHFEPETQIKIIRILHDKLKDSGLKTVISASDETNLDFGIKIFKAYQKAGDIFEKLAQFNVHTYGATPQQRQELKELCAAQNIPLWQSESGPIGFNGTPYQINLKQAGRMFEDLIYMRPEAWLDWLIVETNPVWGLFYSSFYPVDFKGATKNLYVRMQVTRFIKQGYYIVESGNKNCLAAVSPNGDTLVFVLLNAKECDVLFDVGGIPQTKSISAWRTTAEEDCAKFKTDKPANGRFEYMAQPLSISTFVLKLK